MASSAPALELAAGGGGAAWLWRCWGLRTAATQTQPIRVRADFIGREEGVLLAGVVAREAGEPHGNKTTVASAERDEFVALT
jgi:hypothetical protein